MKEDDTPKLNLLIVDDAPANIKVLVNMLNGKYEISIATSGPEAIELATSSTCSSREPALILLDIVMPDMNGYEVCRELKKNPCTKDIPVIFITANTDDETLKQAFEAGGADYVRKPVSNIELLARIESALSHQELTHKLMEEEKLQGVIEMAGAICHELNQPMQTILGFSELLSGKLPEDDSSQNYLAIIREQISRMGKITRKLMSITRYETLDYVRNTKIIDINKASDVEEQDERDNGELRMDNTNPKN